jgi:DNA-binding transcriptional ArsR family regulator
VVSYNRKKNETIKRKGGITVDQELAAAIANEFKNNLKVLTAIGDATRQAILMALIEGPQNPGMRVGEIRVKTHLSRPAVSHHLKILKEAQIISVRKEGTLNYYRLDSGSKLKLLKNLVNEIEKVLAQCEGQASEHRSGITGRGNRQ